MKTRAIIEDLTKILNSMDKVNASNTNVYRSIQNLKINIECELLKERDELKQEIKNLVSDFAGRKTFISATNELAERNY